MRDISSAFFQRLQLDDANLIELIDMVTPSGQHFHWTSANQRITATWSGVSTNYDPFPGNTLTGVELSSDLVVNVIDFVVANTGDLLKSFMSGGDFAMSKVAVTQVFADTPDLGRLPYMFAEIGDYAYNRDQIIGQARNKYQGTALQWPPYTYQDTCGWRFGSPGCGFNTASVSINVSTSNIAVNSSTTLVLRLTGSFLTQSYDNGRFDFGRLTVTNGVNSGQVRTIRVHSGNTLALSHPLPLNNFANIAFTIFPGCRKRLIDDCKSLYNNAENFFGFPWIPIQENAF